MNSIYLIYKSFATLLMSLFVTFDRFKASLVNKSIYFFEILLTPTFERYIMTSLET